MGGAAKLPVIAVVDWGIGGLGLYAALADTFPESLVYFSDAGSMPYGKTPARNLAARLSRVAHWLRTKHVTHLAVACNAASSVLPRLGLTDENDTLITPAGPVTIASVVPHAVRCVRESGNQVVGVIGGVRTIRTGIYHRALRDAGIIVRGRVAQPLSAHVEAGRLDGADVEADIHRILRPLRTVDAILLACTHYPALSRAIAKAVPHARLLDPVPTMKNHIETAWRAMVNRNARAFVVTTGNPDPMRTSARLAFGVDLPSIDRVPIELE